MPSLFKSLEESALSGELILQEGGILQYHYQKKHPGVVTIYIILVLPEYQGKGVGTSMLEELKSRPEVNEIRAAVEADAPANEWYKRQGFVTVVSRVTKSGKLLNIWVWRRDGEVPEVSPLRQARLTRGMTLEDVSKATGVDISTLSAIERGQYPLFPDTRDALKTFFGPGVVE